MPRLVYAAIAILRSGSVTTLVRADMLGTSRGLVGGYLLIYQSEFADIMMTKVGISQKGDIRGVVIK